MRTAERQFSDFLRQPNDVVAELRLHDVVLRRRNAPSLRLSEAERDLDRVEAFSAVARALHYLAMRHPGVLESSLDEALPWSRFLPKADRAAFACELTHMLVASAEIENFAPVAQLLREWKNTAEIHADPALAKRLRKSIVAKGERVARPVR